MTSELLPGNIAPGAREFLSAGLASLEHACTHMLGTSHGDAAQVVMSLAHGVEMLCKGVLLHRGETIHERGNRTISLRDALEKIGRVRHAPSMLVLVDRRDAIQHAAAYMDPGSMQDYLQMAREFVGDLLGTLGMNVDVCPEQPPTAQVLAPTAGELLEGPPAKDQEQQRDAAYAAGVLAWAQGAASLRIRMRAANEISWLSPEDSFEYMPRTDGRHLAAYRQSGGIVVYDLSTGGREVVIETGGPGAVENGRIAAQGIGVPEGLGGGVWLLTTDGSQLEQVSAGGDSPRLSGERLVWQEFRDQEHLILLRSLTKRDETVLVRGGQHPAIHGDLIAWTRNGTRPSVHARDLSTGDERQLSDSGIFPDVRNGLVTFLELRGDLYDLRVVSWMTGYELVRVRDVGFPVGQGPTLTDSEIVWEMQTEGVEHRLWHLTLPSRLT